MPSATERAPLGRSRGISHSVPLRASAKTVSRATAGAPYTASPAAKSHATVSSGNVTASTWPPVVPR